ncbi:hypothetical protein [Aeribacillus pallidus]|uniref:hypothetical protein n=1 Tax=Aeribacillus pallidus TaxID=33936 RepID=UPI003D20A77E
MAIPNLWKLWMYKTLRLLEVDELQLPTETIEEFERLYETYIVHGHGDVIPYTSPFPKYMFLHYLIEQKQVLIHGSNIGNIERFEPKEQLLFNGKPVKAVFAASDGIWPMFFACINRREYTGSLRNACLTVPTKKGIKRFYYFSVEPFEGELWNDGWIYIMPKQMFTHGGIKDEWICETHVKPLAKLAVTPADFPFLKNVRYHNRGNRLFNFISKFSLFKSKIFSIMSKNL